METCAKLLLHLTKKRGIGTLSNGGTRG